MNLIELTLAGITLIAAGSLTAALSYAGSSLGDWGPCPQGGEHQWGQDPNGPRGKLKCVKCGSA